MPKRKKLTHLELKRYHRQILMDGWGTNGQETLKKSCVFIAGAGGLGSPVAIYLAAAGVGRLEYLRLRYPGGIESNPAG